MKWIAFSIFLMVSVAYPHPVAYEGAFSLMSLNTSGGSENTLIYSPTHYFGVGVKHVQMNDKDHDDNTEKWTNFHLGFLAKRWNELESQGNLYLFGGPGILQKGDQEKYFTQYGVQADWESRRYYTLFRYTGASSKIRVRESYKSRFGIAPYIGKYNELNTWLIFQVEHQPQEEKETTITPYVRMYYKNVLWEVGASLDQEYMLNFMVRF